MEPTSTNLGTIALAVAVVAVIGVFTLKMLNSKKS